MEWKYRKRPESYRVGSFDFRLVASNAAARWASSDCFMAGRRSGKCAGIPKGSMPRRRQLTMTEYITALRQPASGWPMKPVLLAHRAGPDGIFGQVVINLEELAIGQVTGQRRAHSISTHNRRLCPRGFAADVLAAVLPSAATKRPRWAGPVPGAVASGLGLPGTDRGRGARSSVAQFGDDFGRRRQTDGPTLPQISAVHAPSNQPTESPAALWPVRHTRYNHPAATLLEITRQRQRVLCSGVKLEDHVSARGDLHPQVTRGTSAFDFRVLHADRRFVHLRNRPATRLSSPAPKVAATERPG